MTPIDTLVTEYRAADILNVSYPYLNKLLDDGELPYSWKWWYRQIPAEALFAYRDRRKAERRRLLKEMMQIDQKHGLL